MEYRPGGMDRITVEMVVEKLELATRRHLRATR